MKILGLLFMLLLSTGAVAWSDADEARLHALNLELRCLVCQNQSIADSDAPLAADLRKQVREMIEQGKSNAEIRDYMTQRYGDFVLYRPPFKPLTWVLWIGPFVVLLLALLVVLRLRKAPATRAAPSDEELRQLIEKTARQGRLDD